MENSKYQNTDLPASKGATNLHRFFVSPENLRTDHAELTGPQAHQIADVLRLRPGRRIIILDNSGHEYELLLTTVTPSRVHGRILDKRSAAGEHAAKITLCQSLLARHKFEWILQKCTELGVDRFVPMITSRSIVRSTAALTPAKHKRWNKIITEAAEQAHQSRIPELAPPVTFEQASSRLTDFDCALIASTAPNAASPKSCLETARSEKTPEIAIFIGPEGGFADTELQFALSRGVRPFTLGPQILRTETAAIVATAIILYELNQITPHKPNET